ncbi:sarcosine oxidase subunit beta family protein [Vineibacter terrae]|uniref:Sarcosine oxidase subunit beta n=1 Tax=Vineibacter terrae TaxID=2586908 RepID=A0A5C8PUI7_9HYPH|nr:sarcosine oxidase subunit beta family protein [Vineibacter terrae]TXL81569.1 sarcosine oxidase subunit beta family protein [Vineibacter terrae]
MARGYSLAALLRHALSGHRDWPAAWRMPEPKASYDVIIIGGGGHGLATAYYLAKNHGITNVAVLEKGWIGGGNTARNTTIIRSNYQQDGNARFYEHSVKLWEGLSRDLNFNVMFSQRGMINLFHTTAERDSWVRRYNSMRLNGIDAAVLGTAEIAALVPDLDLSPHGRHPVLGGVIQRRAGVARHDAVAWGFGRAADQRGVDIIQNCAVTGIVREGGRVVGVETTRGRILARKVASCVAGNSSRIGEMAGLRLPIESHLLQAMVSEPVKPFLNVVLSSGAHRVYVSQTDKGEVLIGGRLDGYNSYSQRGSLPVIEEIAAGAAALLPRLKRLRLMRSWAGLVDMTMDGSAIISKTPVEGFYLNGGWCYGGFKATPASGWCFAHLIANDAPHPLAERHRLDRFTTGHTINERGAGPAPHLH